MQLDWSLTAASYLDQLSLPERSKVLHATEQLSSDWDSLEGSRLHQVAPVQEDLFSLRAGSELRVLVRRQGDTITVVDVVRTSQIEALRRTAEKQQATPV